MSDDSFSIDPAIFDEIYPAAAAAKKSEGRKSQCREN